MKQFAATLLVALAAAAPSGDLQMRAAELMSRQTAGGSTSSQLEQGACKGATFIWARGTMEPGNMGWIIGNYLTPILHKGLNNDIAVQGVKYDAGILTNIGPGMADAKGVAEAQRLFKLAASKCPNTIITGGGYSQGAAIMHRAIEKLDETTKAKISAILLYGDTQYASDGQSIKGFPKDKVKVICKPDDGVCVGYITVTAGHLSYSGKAQEGADWVIEKVKAARKSGGSSAPAASESGGEGEAAAPAEEAPAPKAKAAPKGKGGAGKGKGGKSIVAVDELTI